MMVQKCNLPCVCFDNRFKLGWTGLFKPAPMSTIWNFFKKPQIKRQSPEIYSNILVPDHLPCRARATIVSCPCPYRAVPGQLPCRTHAVPHHFRAPVPVPDFFVPCRHDTFDISSWTCRLNLPIVRSKLLRFYILPIV